MCVQIFRSFFFGRKKVNNKLKFWEEQMHETKEHTFVQDIQTCTLRIEETIAAKGFLTRVIGIIGWKELGSRCHTNWSGNAANYRTARKFSELHAASQRLFVKVFVRWN